MPSPFGSRQGSDVQSSVDSHFAKPLSSMFPDAPKHVENVTWSKAAAIRRQQLSMTRCSLRVRAHSGDASAELCSAAARARAHEMPGACLRHVSTKVSPKLRAYIKGRQDAEGSNWLLQPARTSLSAYIQQM